MGLVVASPRH